MIKIVPAEVRHYSDKGRVKSFFLFPFSDYYDPENTVPASKKGINSTLIQKKADLFSYIFWLENSLSIDKGSGRKTRTVLNRKKSFTWRQLLLWNSY
jgi:hypothetical protein